MRWCRNCDKVNNGWPARCRHCAAGLDGRLCKRGHVNPIDPALAFCGECGQPLERKCGAGFSVRPYLVAAFILACAGLLCLGLLLLAERQEATRMSLVLALVILVIGTRFAFQVLPPWAGILVRDTINFLLRLVLGTGNKG